MKAYDLGFGPAPNQLRRQPTHPDPIILRDPFIAGWCGGQPSGIATAAWPRSHYTGMPMVHIITLELPPEYRRKGEDLVAISFFQADDHTAHDVAGADEVLAGAELTEDQAADPYFAELAAAHAARHPRQRDIEDYIGGTFALIWLTEAEFRAPRTALPTEIRPDGYNGNDDYGNNPWDDTAVETTVWLGERHGDPNTGIAPSEDGDYVDFSLSEEPRMVELWKAISGRTHLGGTTTYVQALPAGLTPYVFELEDGVGGVNFGGGNAQIDLESDVFDWAQ